MNLESVYSVFESIARRSSGNQNFWAKQGPQGDRATEPLSPLVVLFFVFSVCGGLVEIVCLLYGWLRVLLPRLLFLSVGFDPPAPCIPTPGSRSFC